MRRISDKKDSPPAFKIKGRKIGDQDIQQHWNKILSKIDTTIKQNRKG